MEKTLLNLVDTFYGKYKPYIPCPEKKVPGLKPDDPNLKARLMAIYKLYVENRGGFVEWDEETMSNIDNAISWLNDESKRWLLLYGSVGNGKTTLLKSISKLLGNNVLYSAQTIYDYFKENENLINIPPQKILFIDDLGAEPEECKIFGEIRHPLSELLLRRYSWNAPTIIATNLPLEDIQKRYGDRLYDRMLEMTFAMLYNSPSYRARG